MPKNPPDGYQRIIPYIAYDDAPAAIDFLCSTFGFEKRFQMPTPDGKIGHAELSYGGDNVLMLASSQPQMEFISPKDVGARYSSILVYVDDVDAHHAHAKAAGADIQSEPEDQFYGDRSYRVTDPEGHQWFFHTHVRDVPPEEMHPPE